MPDMEQLASAMLRAAATVLGRLVEQAAEASGASKIDHHGSVKIDADVLVALADVPALGVKPVVCFRNDDVARIVTLMLGGMGDGDMGAMQLSIVSETVSQVAASMAEALARELGASTDGVRADLCTDVTNLPAPPFASYAGTIQVGTDVSPEIEMHFDGIALAKIAGNSEPARVAQAPAPPKRQTAMPAAQPVAFAEMAPTARASHGANNLDLVHDVPLQISAVLGRTALPLRDVVTMQSGSVFELDKLAAEPIDLYVNNILIARGEVVVVDDKFAVKISELNPTLD